jgi:hypothetical protein
LPAHPPELSPLVEVLVHSTGRVRFQTNDYSVPIHYAHQRLTLSANPFRVCVFAGSELVADHPRCYQKHQVIEDWRHYVPLLLKKSFAVPWASALRHGDLPGTFEAARLELVAQRSDGNREFARLLELCLTHEVSAVEAALAQVRTKGGWSVDAVRQLLNFASATPLVLATWHICSEKATVRAIERTFTRCRSTCNQVKFEDVDRCSFCS